MVIDEHGRRIDGKFVEPKGPVGRGATVEKGA